MILSQRLNLTLMSFVGVIDMICSSKGNVLLYIRNDIPSKLLTDYKAQDGAECFFVEINIQKKKWLQSWPT